MGPHPLEASRGPPGRDQGLVLAKPLRLSMPGLDPDCVAAAKKPTGPEASRMSLSLSFLICKWDKVWGSGADLGRGARQAWTQTHSELPPWVGSLASQNCHCKICRGERELASSLWLWTGLQEKHTQHLARRPEQAGSSSLRQRPVWGLTSSEGT